jgi:hypothetical protein
VGARAAVKAVCRKEAREARKRFADGNARRVIVRGVLCFDGVARTVPRLKRAGIEKCRRPGRQFTLAEDPMKTLAIFSNPTDAHLLITRLGGSGVQASARDDFVVSLASGATGAFGGVKVEVTEEDYERARAVMDAPAVDERPA